MLLPACGLIVGIKDLDADPADSGTIAIEDTSAPPTNDAAPMTVPDAKPDTGPPGDAGCTLKTTPARLPDVIDVGGGGIAWSQPDAVKNDDGVPAVGPGCCQLGTDDSQVLRALGFAFAVPATATIRGVKVEVKIRKKPGSPNGDTFDRSMTLLPGPGREMKSDAPYPTTYETRAYGGPDDTWGVALTPAIVNAPSFGVAFQISHQPFQKPETEVDFIRATVVYCE